jgi:hypothetical protein
MLARCEGALQACNSGGLSPHALGDLGLREAGFLAGFKQSIQKGGLLAFDALNLGSDAWTLHELFYNLIMSSHV